MSVPEPLDGQSALVRALLEPRAYPQDERPDHVELVETHVSWLFLTTGFVYKVKKAVDYGFLDFTTLERRRFYCGEEVRLNRRLSPDVYLGVAEISHRDGGFALGAEGPVAEYAVKMRRLPQDSWLSAVLDRGEGSADLARRIAGRIAQFHASAATDDRIREIGGIRGVRVNTAENFAQTEEFIDVTIRSDAYDRVRAFTEAFLDARRGVFERREREGRIRDCHGDLHADQICVEDGIAFIDCIEFNERFRFGDVAADVAFPAMDLEYHGQRGLADELVRAYVEASGDAGVLDVLDFYRCYRAYTRGKVRSFRLRQPDVAGQERAAVIDQAARYFALAARYARLPGPLLVAISGGIGTGKTTLARVLAPRLDAKLISSDVVRKKLAGLRPDTPQPAAWGEGIYTAEHHRRTYDELHQRAAERLLAGERVILDASYREAAWRREARDTAQRAGAPFLLLETACPESIVRERLAGRGAGPSDGRLELLEAQRRGSEPVGEEVAPGEHAVIDTGASLAAAVAVSLRRAYVRRFED